MDVIYSSLWRSRFSAARPECGRSFHQELSNIAQNYEWERLHQILDLLKCTKRFDI